MRWVFAAGLLAGFVLLVVAVIRPATRWGKLWAAGLTAFGIGGLSAAYAGWPVVSALASGMAAGAVFGWYAGREEA